MKITEKLRVQYAINDITVKWMPIMLMEGYSTRDDIASIIAARESVSANQISILEIVEN